MPAEVSSERQGLLRMSFGFQHTWFLLTSGNKGHGHHHKPLAAKETWMQTVQPSDTNMVSGSYQDSEDPLDAGGNRSHGYQL